MAYLSTFQIGVVVLHLLLIPGTSFITGGARIMHQDLHADTSQLNHTLLTVGFVQPRSTFFLCILLT